MASLSGVSNSGNTLSSLMNSANMITGLASGLDTESMIESLVQSYQAKINQYNQSITKLEWKQEAYRSIISKLYNFSNKYTSYTSSTNLMSRSFFSNAVTVSALGKYADAVSASGKTSSDISINSVQQLAKAAQYRTKSNLGSGDTGAITGKEIGLFSEDEIELGNLRGSLTLTYGNKTVKINFDETEDVEAINEIREKLIEENDGDETKVTDTEVLAELINKKLADQKITFTNGNVESADQRIKATADASGKITFSEQGKAGNGVYISGASGNIASQLGLSSSDLKNASEKKVATLDTNKLKISKGDQFLTRSMSGVGYLAEQSGKTMSVSLDGTTKSITTPKINIVNEDGVEKYSINGGEAVSREEFAEKYANALQDSLNDAFGEGKVKVTNGGAEDGSSLQLKFEVAEGSKLEISTDAGNAMGIGATAASYLTTGKTLGELMGDKLDTLDAARDEDGNELKDKNGNTLYEFKLNGVVVGTYSRNSTLEEIMNDINDSEEAGVKAAYSQTTQSFTFTAKETGTNSKVEFGGGLASEMFGNKDAAVSVKSGTKEILGMGEDDKLTDKSFSIIVGEGDDAQKVKFNFSLEETSRLEHILGNIERALGEGTTAEFSDIDGSLIITKNGEQMKVTYGSESNNIAQQLVEKIGEKQGYTKGQDAVLNVTINGEEMQLTRSSNNVDIDGLNITLKDTFTAENANDAVTFKTNTDSDRIIDAIKEMVNDYNVMMTEVKLAYSTMPYQNSSGAFGSYAPLTEDDMSGMTESAIARYEEKAKQGLLFGDRNLSALYSSMYDAFSFTNKADVDTLNNMGISISFNSSDGSQVVTIDEDKLRAMLDSDPDRVANLFNKTDGIMDRMKTQLDAYAKTTGEPKGILIQQAGSPLSSLSLMNNQWQSEIDNYNTQIDKWQTKLQSQVERYTSQFARLEQLINQMNSQSSTLAGLMGG